MSRDDPRPEPDRLTGAPHPRETTALIGHDRAEAAFLDAFTSGRLHHAWLIAGPKGIGKATLAWRIARFLLATPTDDGGMFDAPPAPTTLDIPADHPVARRMLALSEPRLALVRRPYDEKASRLRAEITVDEIRRLKQAFTLSATDGGRRAVIVDAADELNVNAANALLKLLEEPPADTVMLLIAHQPSRLLPTIRSRCRDLRCHSLSPQDLAAAMTAAGTDPGADAPRLTALSGGSVGDALRLHNHDGLKLYAEILAIFDKGFDRPRALKLADSAVGKTAEARRDLIFWLLDLFLARLARTGAAGPPDPQAAPGEALMLARLSPDAHAARRWAERQQDLGARARHGRAVNLDPAALILDTLLKIHETAQAAPAG